MAGSNRTPISLRIPKELMDRVNKAHKGGHYQLTLTSVVIRGLELACDEIENAGLGK